MERPAATSDRSATRWRKVVWGMILLGLVAGFCVEAWRRDRVTAQVVGQLHAGLTNGEVAQILAPVRPIVLNTKSGGLAYMLRGVDEMVVVEVEGQGLDSPVLKVRRLSDTGPFWERIRRNWSARFR